MFFRLSSENHYEANEFINLLDTLAYVFNGDKLELDLEIFIRIFNSKGVNITSFDIEVDPRNLTKLLY